MPKKEKPNNPVISEESLKKIEANKSLSRSIKLSDKDILSKLFDDIAES
jgi:hypothetical protein